MTLVITIIVAVIVFACAVVAVVSTLTRGQRDLTATNKEIAANARPPGLAIIGSETCECGLGRGVYRNTDGTRTYVADCPRNPRHALIGETLRPAE